jgi:hypothetical protein
MPTVSNKTQKPLSIPLPGGKTLHLGPGKTGQISPKAAGSAQLKKLVDAGDIELVIEDDHTSGGAGGDKKGRPSFYGHSTVGGMRRSGDR